MIGFVCKLFKASKVKGSCLISKISYSLPEILANPNPKLLPISLIVKDCKLLRVIL